MLTSSNPSNQYLRPDYLTPLPSTLDAKNSPLALLAQTCSAIGADTPNPKLLANIEKSTKNHKSAESREKSSPVSSQSSSSLSTGSLDISQQKSSFKPYESNPSEERSSSRTRTPKSTSQITLSGGGGIGGNVMATNLSASTLASATVTATNLNGRCDSNQSATSQRDSPIIARKTPASTINNNNNNIHEQNPSPHRASSSKESPNMISTINGSSSQGSPALRLSSSGGGGGGGSDGNGNNINGGNSLSTKDNLSISKSSSLAPTTTTVPSTSNSAYYQGYPGGLPYPMDLMTASALMNPHHPMFKTASLSPYLNYARLKGATDPSAMISSVCRDPYCTGCPLNPHIMNKATGQPCPAGCTQCDQSAASKSYQQQQNTAAAAYAHAQLAALAAASQLPYVCSWIGGDAAYCGKRFGTSDELFQHLRTHTASMPESMLNAAAAAGLPTTHPLFQRTYPTPPLSPLSTARYHPYGKPSMLPPSLAPPSLAGLQMPPHPSLAQYFSPYSLYGPRLGTPPSMHP